MVGDVTAVSGVVGSACNGPGGGVLSGETAVSPVTGLRPRATATMGASRGGAAGWRLTTPGAGLAAGFGRANEGSGGSLAGAVGGGSIPGAPDSPLAASAASISLCRRIMVSSRRQFRSSSVGGAASGWRWTADGSVTGGWETGGWETGGRATGGAIVGGTTAGTAGWVVGG